MAAVLSAELGNAEKVSHFIDEALAMGMTVLGPDVNESRMNFTPVFRKPGQPPAPGDVTGGAESWIRFGMAGIKGVGEGAAQKILEERSEERTVHRLPRVRQPRGLQGREPPCARMPGEDWCVRFHRRAARLDLPPTRRTHLEAAERQRDALAKQDSFLDMLNASAAPAPGSKAAAGLEGRSDQGIFAGRDAPVRKGACSVSTSPAIRWTPSRSRRGAEHDRRRGSRLAARSHRLPTLRRRHRDHQASLQTRQPAVGVFTLATRNGHGADGTATPTPTPPTVQVSRTRRP